MRYLSGPIFDEFIADLIPIMDAKLINQGKFSEYFKTMTDEQVEEVLKNIWVNSKNYDKVLKNTQVKYQRPLTLKPDSGSF